MSLMYFLSSEMKPNTNFVGRKYVFFYFLKLKNISIWIKKEKNPNVTQTLCQGNTVGAETRGPPYWIFGKSN